MNPTVRVYIPTYPDSYYPGQMTIPNIGSFEIRPWYRLLIEEIRNNQLRLVVYVITYMSHGQKNPTLLSIESWLVNRDDTYFMVCEIIPI